MARRRFASLPAQAPASRFWICRRHRAQMPTGRSPGSLAWAGLGNSYYWIDPVRMVTGVFATQILPFYDEKAVKAFEGFETAVYQAL